MRTILIFTVITLLSVVSLHAQTGKPIRGTVVDDASGMPLPYVTIVVLNSGQPLKQSPHM